MPLKSKAEIERVCRSVSELLRQFHDDMKKLPSLIKYEERFYIARSMLYDAGRLMDSISPHAMDVEAKLDAEDATSAALAPANRRAK